MNNLVSNLYKLKKSDYFSNVRSEIINLLPHFSEKVLDIGCGDGATLDWIRSLGKCNKTYGIEISTESYLKSKKNLDKTLNINVENESNFFPGEKFNLILVLDVLEHLVDPWKFLKMIKSRLSDRGTLIISVPNIRHYSVIKDLIFFGRWEYEESGILDSTHLRFFTKKSLLKMFNNEQLKNEVILNYPIDFRGKAKILNMLTLNFFSNFLTQTYFFKLEKC